MYKTKHNNNPNFMKDIFVEKRDTGYSLRSKEKQDFESMNIHKAHTGEDTLRFLGCKISTMIPFEVKEADTLNKFKKFIRNWKPLICPSRMCKTYLRTIKRRHAIVCRDTVSSGSQLFSAEDFRYF